MYDNLKLQYLRPDQILASQELFSAVYLPVGPLEWHGPHNPVGLDPLHAEALALECAKITGGLVAPTLYIGTECLRDAAFLKALHFNGDESITGMDFPGLPLKSGYVDEKSFFYCAKACISSLAEMGFRLIVIINGHGATGQVMVLDNLAQSSADTASEVINLFGLFDMAECEADQGHATKLETSVMMHIYPESVNIDILPSKEDMPALSTRQFGIMDALPAYALHADDSIIHDPRDASPELGKLHMEKAVRKITDAVKQAYKKI